MYIESSKQALWTDVSNISTFLYIFIYFLNCNEHFVQSQTVQNTFIKLSIRSWHIYV